MKAISKAPAVKVATEALNGPKSPSIVQMLQWTANPVSFMNNAAQRYGHIFISKIGWNFRPLIFVSDPQALQKIFTNPNFQAPGTGERIFQPLLGEYSISRTLDSARYRRKRQLLMPPFHGDRVGVYGQLIYDVTEQVMKNFAPGKPFSTQIAMQEISLEVILGGVFGICEGERRDILRQLLISWLESMSDTLSSSMLYIPFLQRDFGPWSPWARLCRLNRQINQLLELEIQERRQEYDSSRTDILTLLMSARDEAGQPMSNEELRDEMLTLLAAGQESTSTSMSMALYFILNHPNVRNQLLEELAPLGDSPDPMAIARLPYLNAVCQETLRLHPPAYVGFPRVVKAPMELMGYKLEPGTEVIPNIYLTHQREDIYPEPQKFKPERFLETKFSPYEYLPFGGGSHICIGGALAMFEMKVVLATILSRYQMALANNRPLRLVVRRITLAPANDLKMVVTGQR